MSASQRSNRHAQRVAQGTRLKLAQVDRLGAGRDGQLAAIDGDTARIARFDHVSARCHVRIDGVDRAGC